MPKTLRECRPALGVDRGGTRTRIVLINGRGAVLKRAVLPTSHIKRLPALITEIVSAWRLGPDVPAIIATRGAMTRKWKKPFLLRALKGRVNLLDVISDALAAYLAAHGSKSGALLIAGTGSVVFLKRRGGRFEKTGGHSPAGGDPGSGLWIGSRFLKMTKGTGKGLDRRSRAAYAAIAVKRAEDGDPAAVELIREAQAHLSGLLAGAVRKHGEGPEPLKVALAGGLMKNDYFRKNLIIRTRERFTPVRLAFLTLKRPAEYAAAKLALETFYGRNKNA